MIVVDCVAMLVTVMDVNVVVIKLLLANEAKSNVLRSKLIQQNVVSKIPQQKILLKLLMD